ncbi:unnamed protein product [Echinostoma caproni]|uniref:P-type Ca(2+) transporter n=1 Tax=Echinostoma caproni TaxID=27848 RepID=A0A3P8GR41_9TREM|nr:unnamed protein product [Echinostoma caproni]
MTILASNLVPGDLVLLSMGDRIPADIRLIEAVGLRVDESSLTGETEAVSKVSRELTVDPGDTSVQSRTDAIHMHQSSEFVRNGNTALEVAALDRLRGCHDLINIGFLGTLVCCGNARGIVIATGERSEFGEVFRMMQSEEVFNHADSERAIEFEEYKMFVFRGTTPRYGFDCLAVAAIPEGLPIVVTVTLALGQMRMAARNAVVRKLPAVETLGCVNVVCADKTGTMTENEMTISQVVSSALERYTPVVVHSQDDVFSTPVHSTAATSSPNIGRANHVLARHESTLHMNPPAVSLSLMDRSKSNNELLLPGAHYCPPTFQKIIEIGCLCNNAVLQNGQLHGQPTEGAFLRLANHVS